MNANPLASRALRAASLVFALVLAACGSGPGESESRMTSFSSGQTRADTASLFTVPQDQMAHVQVVAVEKSSLPRILRLTGSVAFNGFATTPVFSPVGGPITQILVVPGERVRAGQPLLTVNSPDYSSARSAFIKARASALLSDQDYGRSQDLYSHHAISERDLQQAQSSHEQAQADLQSARDALRALGIADPDSVLKNSAAAAGQVSVPAPVSGEVVERLVSPGQLLQPGATQCFTISDMSTVWVLVNVYQNDLPFVRRGDSVDISTDAYPDTFHGRISYIASALDPGTRTLQARIIASNPGEKLKKDMYVTATVNAGAVSAALSVPDASVLRDSENQPFVYVQSGDNQFARRPVTLGGAAAGRTQILTGVKEGERVIAGGSLFLQFKNSLQQ